MTMTGVVYSNPIEASGRKWSRPADAKPVRQPALRPARQCANAPVSGARMARNRLDGHPCCFSSSRLAICGVRTSYTSQFLPHQE